MMQHVLIIGAGYLGSFLANQLVEANFKVSAIKRSQEQLVQGVNYHFQDITKLSIDLKPYDSIVYMVAADNYSDEAYQAAYVTGIANVYNQLEHELHKFIFVSSTSVLADGELVDESSPLTNNSMAQHLINGEAIASKIPNSHIVRFSGIYGDGRISRFQTTANNIKNGLPVLTKSNRYLNNIHVKDCAGSIKFLLENQVSEKYLIVTDSNPIRKNQLCQFFAELLDLELNRDFASESPRFNSNKRLSNKKILQLGYNFIYPNLLDYLKNIKW